MAHTFLQTVQTFATCYDYHLFYHIFLFAFTDPIDKMPKSWTNHLVALFNFPLSVHFHCAILLDMMKAIITLSDFPKVCLKKYKRKRRVWWKYDREFFMTIQKRFSEENGHQPESQSSRWGCKNGTWRQKWDRSRDPRTCRWLMMTLFGFSEWDYLLSLFDSMFIWWQEFFYPEACFVFTAWVEKIDTHLKRCFIFFLHLRRSFHQFSLAPDKMFFPITLQITLIGLSPIDILSSVSNLFQPTKLERMIWSLVLYLETRVLNQLYQYHIAYNSRSLQTITSNHFHLTSSSRPTITFCSLSISSGL